MPRATTAWVGADALWITVAGWASAHEAMGGLAVIATTNAVLTVEQTLALTGRATSGAFNGKKQLTTWVLAKQIMKDIRLCLKPTTWPIEKWLQQQNQQPVFIWEQHDLVAGVGYKLAKKYKVPLIKYVHAPVVWETKKWGVNRGFWGSFLEYFAEAKALRKATCVAVVTKQVAEKVEQLGVAKACILISPMAVDINRFPVAKFAPNAKLCIGWMGSFRMFHGLQTVLEAFAAISTNLDCTLLLVGDGADKPIVEQLSATLGIQEKVVFAGKKKFTDIPAMVAQMDICIVSANDASTFHYSPLKLREFMAAGKPCIAPFAGDLPKEFVDGEEVLLYQVGNTQSLTEKLHVLVNNEHVRQTIGAKARSKMEAVGTWEYQLRKARSFCNI